MGQTDKLALTLLAGFALGAGAIGALKAQGNKSPAYVIGEVEVTDPAGFQQYVAKAPPTSTPYHGQTVARGNPDTKEGAAPNDSVVVPALDNLADAEGWYGSAA